MKRLLIAPTMVALLLAGPAFAKDHGHGHGNDHDKGDRHGMAMPHEGIRVGEPNPHAPDWRGRDVDYGKARHDNDYGKAHHDNGRHLGQYKHWARGQRLPRTYLEPRYYVREYRTYNLAPPPRGMVWVRPYQNDRNFYLVQVATGLISQILGR